MKNPRPSIQQLLEAKLHLKRARLYDLAKDIADTLSISTKDGMLVLAAQQRINLQKCGLAPAKIEQVRALVSQMPSAAKTAAREPARASTGKIKASRTKKAFRVKLQRSETDPILPAATLNEMKAMVQVYETLYHLENSIRVFITRVLKAKHGADWWDRVAPNGLKTHVERRTQDDEINAWHQKRSSNPIDYLDLNQLPPLVRATLADFVPTFFTMEWFQGVIDEVYRSRCVGCHMNPLTQNNVDAVGVRFNHWQTLVKEKLSALELLESPPPPAAVPAAAPAASGPPAATA